MSRSSIGQQHEQFERAVTTFADSVIRTLADLIDDTHEAVIRLSGGTHDRDDCPHCPIDTS